jgi:hypothetical protein
MECILKNTNRLYPYKKLSVFYNSCLKTFGPQLVLSADCDRGVEKLSVSYMDGVSVSRDRWFWTLRICCWSRNKELRCLNKPASSYRRKHLIPCWFLCSFIRSECWIKHQSTFVTCKYIGLSFYVQLTVHILRYGYQRRPEWQGALFSNQDVASLNNIVWVQWSIVYESRDVIILDGPVPVDARSKGVHTRTSLASESGWARVPMSQTGPCVECHESDFGRLYIHSFSILSADRSKASSKTVPPHSAI